MLFLPIRSHQLISGRFRLPRQQRHQFVNAFSSIQRRNQRLNDAYRSVIGSRITPRFQVVRLIDVPLAEFGRLILMKPEMHAQRNLGVLERVGKIQVRGSIVGGIAAQDQQHVHFPAAHIADQITQRLDLVYGLGIDRIGVNHRAPHVAECLIDGMPQGVHHWWLVISDDNDPSPAARSEVVDHCR